MHTVQIASGKDIAQTLVEGYYTMLGGDNVTSVVVALTNIQVTHFFRLQLPVTRDVEAQRHLEVTWHHELMLENYPPSKVEVLSPLIELLHTIFDEQA